jgi:RND family efflux transporter MFP subunit
LLTLLAGWTLACGHTHADKGPRALVETTEVKTHRFTPTLTAYGTLEADPDKVLVLSLSHAGLINRVWVSLGQRVQAGDPLIDVVTAPADRMLYLQAQSAVDYARRELQRQQRLLKEQLATQEQVDAAHKALRDAQATLEALKRQGKDQSSQLVRSPREGIIARLDVQQGQRVQAGSPALLLAGADHLITRAGVEPEDLLRLRAGMPVTLSSVFVPQQRIRAQLRDVHAMINPATRLVDVLIPIPTDQADDLVLGSRMIAAIELASHTGLAVPRSAVLRDRQGIYLFTIRNGVAHRIDVTTGTEQADLVEITGNIQVGEPVVVTGNYELSEGMSVRESAP